MFCTLQLYSEKAFPMQRKLVARVREEAVAKGWCELTKEERDLTDGNKKKAKPSAHVTG